MTTAVLSALIRPLVEPHIPAGVDVRYFASLEDMRALAPEAEIGWFDLNDKEPMVEAVKVYAVAERAVAEGLTEDAVLRAVQEEFV